MPYTLPVQASWTGTLFPSNVEDLFRRIASGLDGDNGGTYGALTQIVIHGSGLAVGSPPVLSAGKLRTIHISALELGNNVDEFPSVVQSTGRFQSLNLGSLTTPNVIAIPLTRISDASVLKSLTANFYVPVGLTSLPQAMPSLNVFRMNPLTGIVESLSSAGAVTYPKPATIAEYETGLLGFPPHQLTFVPDPDSDLALIDQGTYSYWLALTDATPTPDHDDSSTPLSLFTYVNSFSAECIIYSVGFQ